MRDDKKNWLPINTSIHVESRMEAAPGIMTIISFN